MRAIAAAALLALASSCTTQQELRAFVQDSAGRPIPDAVFYAEAYASGRAVDFTWCVSGPKGEVPPPGHAPLALRATPGAKLALAVMAPGKKPVVVYDELGRVRADGTVFNLKEVASGELAWEPRMGRLGFPFEEAPELAERAAAPELARLRAAFRAAYAAIPGTGLPNERIKREALERLEAR
jgi:hypothetical protein